MTAIYSHSRAAILCFGGWGLQTMLHLQPRLRDAQERRDALNAIGPDLTRIVNFAVLLPEPLLDSQGYARFTLRQLRPHTQFEPFYIEKMLDRITADQLRSLRQNALLSAGEVDAATLLAAVEHDLVALGYNVAAGENQGFRTQAAGIATPPIAKASPRATCATPLAPTSSMRV